MADANDSVGLLFCSVDGCSSPATREGAQLCEMHYTRKRRNGYTDPIKRPVETKQSAGYILQIANGHPIARGKFRAYQHRIVYYDHCGAGPFKCHWCNTSVTWDDLHIDHVDDDIKNNDISNLVASCATCNKARGSHKALAKWRDKTGIALDGIKKTINEWSSHYGISRSAIQWRVRNGWAIEAAIKTPRGKFGPQQRKRVGAGQISTALRR